MSVLLVYPRLQFAPDDSVKPDGSLSLPYLAGALTEAGVECKILDASVGTGADDLDSVFYSPKQLDTGFIRVGISDARILEEAYDYDIIGFSSIFTTQTTQVLEMVRLVRNCYPEKTIIAGGVNARHMALRFLDAGCDAIATSEAEDTIVQIAQGVPLADVPGLILPGGNTGPASVVTDLDEIPVPRWDMLPNDRYWDISRPHGGDFKVGERVQYASMLTSRGCPFSCSYCHISKEIKGSLSGNIGGLRLHSMERVCDEIDTLSDLGAEYIFIEDDSLLAKKARVLEIFEQMANRDLRLIDVNGVNIVHMMQNHKGKLVPDMEMLSALKNAGFEKISLPFESGSQRILNKYASRKWNVEKLDTIALIRACIDTGITVLGNYTIGYPDETFDEMMDTVKLARSHADAGLSVLSFFVIVPFPGTTLFDEVIRSGQLDSDFNPDDLRWTHSVLKNTPVSAETTRAIRTMAWHLLNSPEMVQNKVKGGVENYVTTKSVA